MQANELVTYNPGFTAGLENRTLSPNDSDLSLNNVYDAGFVLNETLVKIFVWFIYIMVFVTGCSGNILVMIAIHQCRQLKGVPAMLLVSLAIADFLVCLLIAPAEIYAYMAVEFHLGAFLCKFITFLNQLVFTCSSFTLTIISVERLYVVKYPLQARSVITTRRARFVIVGTWLFAVLCAVPNTYRQEHINRVHGIYRWSVCIPNDTKPWIELNALFDFFVKFAFPVLIMAISYAVVIVTLYKSTRQSKRLQSIKMSDNKIIKSASNGETTELTNKSVKNMAKKTKAEKQQADRNQAIIMLLIVVVLFFVTWGPFMIYQLLDRLSVIDAHLTSVNRLIFIIVRMLAIANSCMNPFLYVFMSKSFRSAITATLCCRRERTGLAKTSNIGRSISGGLSTKTTTSHYSISGIN
ncbi:allatostatin-A receptor-like isoform X2 [Anneissia japonica]|uniref:allatostatin-A receptor-like isoform X2 n=1 Tax=Anneissia japonica TaxID=1529436 RepID=UPI00142597F4|nr:allatostatin-A receptor-like isoform X2 [Anneissia japonica]XP_033122008.1 allatostatin-A receptor-like isoform X2 [Anneissia japonica]